MTVVPTTYHAPRSFPIRTNQYSVTHYTRQIQHGTGAPGIFFKFDVDPISVSIYQRTTSLVQFLIRIIGVLGGVWVCAGWTFKVTNKAVTAVVGDGDEPIVQEAKSSSRKRWMSTDLTRRKGSWNPQQGGWVTENGSPYASYNNTPTSAVFGPGTPASPSYVNTTMPPPHRRTASASFTPGTFGNYPPSAPPTQTSFGAPTFPPSPGPGTSSFPVGPPTPSGASFPRTPSSLAPPPITPGSGQFPVTPTGGQYVPASPIAGGFPRSPVPGQTFGPNVIMRAPPPKRMSRLNPNRASSSGSGLSGASGASEGE